MLVVKEDSGMSTNSEVAKLLAASEKPIQH
jgi:hypothetical protein